MTTRYDLADPTLLFRPDVLDQPARLFAQLLAEAPIWEIPGTDTFVVSSAALVVEAVSRTGDFSSNLTSLIFQGDDGRPCVFDMAPLGEPTHVLATADPPVHTTQRKIVQPSLAAASITRRTDDITTIVDSLLDDLLATGGGDAVAALADPLPMRVLARVLGLPASDAAMLTQLVLDTDEILAGVNDAGTMARAADAAAQQVEYLTAHLTRVLAAPAIPDPPDTMIEVLARGVRGGDLSFGEAVGILVQMLGAGTDTTASLVGTAIGRLIDDQEVQARLRADPALVPTFVEEMLRLEGPFQFHYRTTPHATELGGITIPARARVLLMWAAANLDPAVFDQPDQLDLDRHIPRSHLAFGRGIHFCVGAPLARLEVAVAITRLLARTGAIRPDPACPLRRRPNIFVRRLAQLGVATEPGEQSSSAADRTA